MKKEKEESYKIVVTEEKICIENASPAQILNAVYNLLEMVTESINHKLEVKAIKGDSLTYKLIPKQKELGSKNEAEKQGGSNG